MLKEDVPGQFRLVDFWAYLELARFPDDLDDVETSGKIISYEPDNLLKVPVNASLGCVQKTNPDDIEKLNKMLKDLTKLEGGN